MMAAPVLPEKTLADLIGARAGAHGDLAVTDIALDSRAVQPGSVFVAISGQRSHGLQYSAEAVARGAVAVLYEPSDRHAPPGNVAAIAVPDLKSELGAIAIAFFGDPARRQALAGITGTNGKTTVAYLIATAMAQLGRPCGYLGTLGSGIPPELTSGVLTTPDCFGLHRTLADLYARSARHVAVEVSSHALDQGRTAGVNFQTAVFTNLSRDHLDYHGDLEHYGRSKARLFAGASLAQAIINLDDPFGEQLARQLAPRVTTIGVSTTQKASRSMARLLRGRITGSSAGLAINYHGPWGEGALSSPLIGGFNGHNLLLALAVLVSWDIDHHQACRALGDCQPPPGRMEAFRSAGSGPLVIVDFAHTPAALAAALDVLRPLTAGRLWCVFGCGGERDRGKRPLMGAAAAARADAIILTSDNPRGESPDAIVAEIKSGCEGAPAVTVELDRRVAIHAAISQAGPDDVVLVAGRGHETWQLIGAERLPMSDREFVVDTLAVGP